MNVSSSIILLFFYLVTCLSGAGKVHNWAQKDTTCKDSKIKLFFYYKNIDNKTIESGILLKNTFIPCDVEVLKGSYSFAFGNLVTASPILFFNCATNQPGKTFNGRQNGQKVGIWFSWYLWGGVRRATMYLDGQRSTVVYFRPNGKLARMLNFKNGKRRKSGNALYDKQGNIIGGRIRF